MDAHRKILLQAEVPRAVHGGHDMGPWMVDIFTWRPLLGCRHDHADGQEAWWGVSAKEGLAK